MSSELFSDFNFSLLNDFRFKEESVREELISPLIKHLGYSNSGNTQVVRNHGLKHPFVSVGSSRRNITVIPDYLMKVAEKPAWVLEAKSPTEPINLTKHAEQAYSYAIHPEIRVNYFALCNGRDFVLYNISQVEPMFHVPMSAMSHHISYLEEIIGPSQIFTEKEFSLSKDLGLHIKRLGFTSAETILIIGVVPMMLEKYDDDHFSFSAPVGMEENTYLGTFDFNLETAMQLLPLLGDRFAPLLQPTRGDKIRFFLPKDFYLNVRLSLPAIEELIEVEREIYLPLEIRQFVKGTQ